MPNPRRDTVAGQVFNDLRNKALRDGRNTDELLVFYTLERFLYRLSSSRFARRFVLKGGLLLAVFDARRPTRDGDLLAYIDHDREYVLRCVSEIAAAEHDDGLVFQPGEARTDTIREDGDYRGLRITIPVELGTARIKLALDVNFGDPVTPGVREIEYPQMLSDHTFTICAYPLETVLAEKIVSMVTLGDLNTRERDWADVWRLIGLHDIDSGQARTAMEATSTYRGVNLRPLSEVVVSLAGRRANAYLAWRRKQGIDGEAYPQTFGEVIDSVVIYADPLLKGFLPGRTWSARNRSWN